MKNSSIFKRIFHAMNPKTMPPKRRNLWIFWIILNIALFLMPRELAYGSAFLLIPMAGLFIYAIVSQEVLEALVLGTLAMYILWYKEGALMAFINTTAENLTDPEVISILMSFMLCGGIIAAFSKSGVTKSFGDLITRKFGSNERLILTSASVFAGAMSVDDFIAAMTAGAAFTPLMDKMKKPRVALSYVMKTFSTCVSNMLPFGAWGYFVIYMIAAAATVDGLGEASKIFMTTIPFQIFPIVACVIALLFSLGLFPKLGPMKEAYRMAEQGVQRGALDGSEDGGADAAAQIEEMIAHDPRKQDVSVWNLILPMLSIIVGMFAFDFDGFKVFAVAIVFTGVLYITQGLFSLSEFISCILEGCQNMLDMSVIMLFGYGFQSIMAEMNFSAFILDVCKLIPLASLIPFIFFVYFSLEEYVVSMNYTLYQILIPVMIVVLPATGANVPLTLGAIMSAVLFGANSCVTSDVGVVAAKACRIKIFDQYVCCQPYYWIAAGITAVVYLVLGFVL